MLVASQEKILDRDMYDNATGFGINAPDLVSPALQRSPAPMHGSGRPCAPSSVLRPT
ncbi:hypothetical protein OG946_21735 [Streptomyces sp. NBC_01808]|uniref:hypothetical protein n=1 Tax=Streptomyces sp. NBC_01808 TaxID=2975947 RepID=UPI002DDB9E46|nr:hypothetical protein [Streptomyces sp. NBC_01808]WSA39759.1 hypothetical protein OG946_21735 [Streptomyces sp. NBC_01808]